MHITCFRSEIRILGEHPRQGRPVLGKGCVSGSSPGVALVVHQTTLGAAVKPPRLPAALLVRCTLGWNNAQRESCSPRTPNVCASVMETYYTLGLFLTIRVLFLASCRSADPGKFLLVIFRYAASLCGGLTKLCEFLRAPRHHAFLVPQEFCARTKDDSHLCGFEWRWTLPICLDAWRETNCQHSEEARQDCPGERGRPDHSGHQR